MKTLNKERLVEVIKSKFPTIDYTIGYGSGFLKQKDHLFNSKSMLDLIFIVENRYDWHSLNFKMNKDHYSGLGYYGGPSYINTLQKHLFHVHYNPMIRIDEFYVKYGIVSHVDFMKEMYSWENFSLAGRLHKPIVTLDANNLLLKGSIERSIDTNRQFAFALSVFINYIKEIPEQMMLETIVSHSYSGDIRFLLNAESNGKIKGILEGQYELLSEIYRKIAKENFSDLIEFDEIRQSYIIKDIGIAKEKFIDYIPLEIINIITGKQWLKEEFGKINSLEMNYIFTKALKTLNKKSSSNLTFYHLLSTSFKKNFSYTKSKYDKNFEENITK